MMNDVVAVGHFRPLQSFDCASKTELGEEVEQRSSWFEYSWCIDLLWRRLLTYGRLLHCCCCDNYFMTNITFDLKIRARGGEEKRVPMSLLVRY